MKRIRCPKCDEAILFDETKYAPGRSLVFECPSCNKQFRLRMPSAHDETEEEAPVYGILTVVENAFQLKQEILLHEGENVIGREVRGSSINCPIKTVDPSIDTTHCIISVKLNRQGEPKFILRDAPSGTGTFLNAEILGDRDRVTIAEGDIITIGAGTMILRYNDSED
ncbi:FHA domain-containing protein [Pseudoprevotella muciniphila]|uniref:FHA domain-containing protein n=1 Tax=Pseudoprevotella muciniphila TaxID=2133944 RepID=A0A5P8E9C4_9BACT|nr:FHA domain-containing protein [Pseudoprevotella muciniphila]MBQ7664044.1 FHA domain-containing protein [Bacteroidaceae bacterium]QFQ13635.1 FHA domain-containing protein [Pseudoprevotella muciniphila]